MTTPAAPVHLNRYHHFTRLMRDPAVECVVSRYTSDFDQTRQSVLVMRPARPATGDLFIFFHGMDGDCGDSVVMKELVTSLGGTVVAPGGRGAAWVSDAFLADAAQIIRQRVTANQRLFLVGISMGATQALVLAAEMPKLSGVIAFIPGADLEDVAANTANARVRISLTASVNNDLRILRERSPANLIDKYSAGLPFVIAYNEADTILPMAATATFVKSLAQRGLPVVSHVMPGDHSFVTDHLDERIDYRAVIASLGKHGGEATPLPTRGGSSAHRAKAG
jgi:poly(3-hydroxybutyrate) depolymerase